MRRLPRSGYGDVVGLHLSQIAEADELLTNDPLALLIGMVLDQPVSERTSALPVNARKIRCLATRPSGQLRRRLR